MAYRYFIQLLRLSTYNVLAPYNTVSHNAKLSDAMKLIKVETHDLDFVAIAQTQKLA